MARSPITGLVEQYQSLTPEEQKVFLDLVDPQPEPAAKIKRTRKTTKRATPLSEERRQTAQKRGLPQAIAADDTEAGGECARTVGDHTCGLPRDNALHHDTVYADYHKFEEVKSKKTAAGK